jgi:hypothetical protein
MPLEITIDIFSGRPNPVIELEDKDAREALERVKPAARLKKNEMGSPEHVLGYRGLFMRQKTIINRSLPREFRVAAGSIFGPELAHTVADPGFEEFFFSTQGPASRVPEPRKFRAFAVAELARLRELKVAWRPEKFPWPLKPVCPCAPLYEPTWWNDGGAKQFGNNCYNYSTNYRTDTFAQPGQANGAMYTSLTCASVLPAAIADALIDSPAANNRCPKEGHLVALVIAPGWDFHWYRKGRNGRWTHKPGGTPATNLDNSGHLIPDPRTADRGPYTDFCTFMVVMHGHIKIR